MTRNIKEFVNQHRDMSAGTDVYGARHVMILLAHYNGGTYLGDQLQSLDSQTHRDWSLILSDDGSSEPWLQVAREFARSQPERQVWLTQGPRRGSAQNFLSLLSLAGPSVPYAAFCDQDDVWCPGKLDTALTALSDVRLGRPALYCGRTTVVDETLTPRFNSPHFARTPSFRNALVQNIAGGNTMVLNRAALDLLQDTLAHAEGIVAHDWWAYQIISGAGGEVLYDTEPQLLYRQHGRNLVGANGGSIARFRRLRALLQGEFRDWNSANIRALKGATHWLTPEARDTLTLFEAARGRGVFRRLSALRRSGLYRQSLQGQLALWAAAVLNRL